MAKSPYTRFGQTALTGVIQVQRKHVVIANDTLPSIAAFWFQDAGYDSELWRQIAEANSIDDLDDLAVGTTLIIPPAQPSDN